jgi:hypothetical protein
MGGAQSLLNENDWEVADGGLESCEQTVDNAEPTDSYRIYRLLKKAVLANQREFDVTDSESNLLYHVRPSPGTIAGFDVLGIGSATAEDYILRVTVDLARRYWIVYRFDTPVFEGQKPDPAATEKFAIEQQTDRKVLAARISASLAIHSFSEDGMDPVLSEQLPIGFKHRLYKVCCVTVSWSRYKAVAAYYGPPTVEQLLQAQTCKETLDEMASEDESELFLKASKIAERLRERRSLADDLVDELETSTPSSCNVGEKSVLATETERSLADDLDESETSNEDDNDAPVVAADVDDDEVIPVDVDDNVHQIQASASMPEVSRDASASPKDKVRHWLKQKSRSIHMTSKSLLRKSNSYDDADESSHNSVYSYFVGSSSKAEEDPLQGVIHLDKPLLLCQEIYTRIVGNHQTSRVSKQKVLTLLKQDMEQHVQKDGGKDDDTDLDRGRGSAGTFTGINEEGPISTAVAALDDLEVASSSGNVVDESKNKVLDAKEEKKGDLTKEVPADRKEQPLVGYWAWENTLRSHQMKMHLAKGADLALHVVLAVIVNQVRYERNAIVMTV